MMRNRKVTFSGLRRSVAIGGLSVLAVAGIAPVAIASGTSGTTNGCYSTWGSTGTNAHCTNPSIQMDGAVRNHASCDFEADKVSGWIWTTRGSVFDNWGQLDCSWHVSRSRVEYTT
ncbi:hypothetical protein ABZ726_22000 [Streptomyces hundungensis]|uniref:hypothetical protein n=1 Tax=Streptomyces hundungensis TaxID=1077946 RepID=UPI00340985D7